MKTKLLDIKGKINLNVWEDTQFVLCVFGEKSGSFGVNLFFDKEEVRAELLVFYVLRKLCSLNLFTLTDHLVPRTSCNTYVKGVLFDGAKSDYIGRIKIRKDATLTSSFLKDDVMVVGENTRNNSQPILEIEADDVSASHGATTGKVNEDQIYYLTSRGLNRKESEGLLVEGFFKSLSGKIIDEGIRVEVERRLKINV